MWSFEALLEINAEEKGNGLTSFKQNDIRKTVVTWADIGVPMSYSTRTGVRRGMIGDLGQAAYPSGREEERGHRLKKSSGRVNHK